MHEDLRWIDKAQTQKKKTRYELIEEGGGLGGGGLEMKSGGGNDDDRYVKYVLYGVGTNVFGCVGLVMFFLRYFFFLCSPTIL